MLTVARMYIGFTPHAQTRHNKLLQKLLCRDCVEYVTKLPTLLSSLTCRWRFSVQAVVGHMVAVALGPPEDVVDAWGVRHSFPLLLIELSHCEAAALVDGRPSSCVN